MERFLLLDLERTGDAAVFADSPKVDRQEDDEDEDEEEESGQGKDDFPEDPHDPDIVESP